MDADKYLKLVVQTLDQVLADMAADLSAVGLVATHELVTAKGYAEVSVYFYDGTQDVADVLESDVLRDNQPVASLDDVHKWMVEGVRAVIADAREGPILERP